MQLPLAYYRITSAGRPSSGRDVCLAASPLWDKEDRSELHSWLSDSLGQAFSKDHTASFCVRQSSGRVAIAREMAIQHERVLRIVGVEPHVLERFGNDPFVLLDSLPLPPSSLAAMPTELKLLERAPIRPTVWDRRILRIALSVLEIAFDCQPLVVTGGRWRETLRPVYELLPLSLRGTLTFSTVPIDQFQTTLHIVFAPSSSEVHVTGRGYLNLEDESPSLPDPRWYWSRLLIASFERFGSHGVENILLRVPPEATLEVLRYLKDSPMLDELFELEEQRRVVRREREWTWSADTVNESSMRRRGEGLLDLRQENVLQQLDALDEVALAAIDGVPSASEELRRLWPKLQQEISNKVLEESRREFVKRAIDHWQDRLASPDPLDTQQLSTALDSLRILLHEEPIDRH